MDWQTLQLPEHHAQAKIVTLRALLSLLKPAKIGQATRLSHLSEPTKHLINQLLTRDIQYHLELIGTYRRD